MKRLVFLLIPLLLLISLLLAAASSYAATAPGSAATSGWITDASPLGISVAHPPAWKLYSDTKLGRITLEGDRGERLILWPMFLENRQLNERAAGGLVRELAPKLEGQPAKPGAVAPGALTWSASKSSGRFVMTTASTAQRKSAVILTWANSPKGATVLLYHISTPPDVYSAAVAVFAAVIRSFQLAAAPAAGATPKKAPLGPLQYVPWSDPLENAFTVQVPRGWKALGGMYRFGAADSRAALTLLSPDGGVLIKLGQKEFGAFMEPIAMPGGGLRSGSLPTAGGSGVAILGYLSGAQFARYYLQHVRQDCNGVQTVSNRDRRDLAGGMMQEAQKQGYPTGQLTVGEVGFTCSGQGAQLQGYYLAATMLLPTDASRRGFGGGMWYVYRLIGYISIPERLKDADAIAQQVLHSLQGNPEWLARSRATSHALEAQDAARSAALQRQALAAAAENERQTTDLISRSYWSQQAAYSEISRQRENAILGTVDVVNPTTGEPYKVQYNSNYQWMNEQGYMAGTLTHDAPAVGWQEMLQLP